MNTKDIQSLAASMAANLSRHDIDLAEDYASAGVLKALQVIRDQPEKREDRPYMILVIKNAVIDAARKWHKSKICKRRTFDVLEFGVTIEDGIADPRDHFGPVESREIIKAALNLVDGFAPTSAIMLLDAEGYLAREIAAQVGLTEAAVKARLGRGRVRARIALAA